MKTIIWLFLVDMVMCINGITDIYLFGLFPLEGDYDGGQGLKPSAMMALDHINKCRDILPGYRLNLDWKDSQCDEGVSIKALSDSLNSQNTKLMVIGAGCSSVSQATARASHLWNLVQISYGSVSPSLSDKTQYPKFFRVIAPESHINAVRIKLLKHFGWKKIATISENQEIFTTSTEDLARRLAAENMTLLTQQQFLQDPQIGVKALKDHDARIIIGNFYPEIGQRVLCEAYKIGLCGPKIIWFIPGWFDSRWFEVRNGSIDCSTSQLIEIVRGSWSLDNVYYNQNDDWSVSGMTSSQFRAKYADFINRTQEMKNLSGHERAPVAYDSIWTAALALNATNDDLQQRGDARRIHNFTYTDVELGRLIYHNVRKTNFTGITGQLQFDDHGDPKSMVSIRTFRGGRNVQIGVSDTSLHKKIHWTSPPNTAFANNIIPTDGVRTEESVRSLVLPVYASMCVLAGLGMLLATVFFVFNVVCRNVRMIKMSSPNMNNVILAGCFITFVSVFIEDPSSVIHCQYFQAKLFVLIVGFAMTFGALVAKTWRVHAVFTAKAMLSSKVYHDCGLFLLVGCLVLVNCGILLIWSLTDPPNTTLKKLTAYACEDPDTMIQPVLYFCTSPTYPYFLGSILFVLGILLLFGVRLAWETRKVNIEIMNDSRYIGMCIYNTVVLQVIGVTVTLALEQDVTLRFALQSLSNILTASVTQTLIFVPKVKAYWKLRKICKSEAIKKKSAPVVKTIHVTDSTSSAFCFT